MFVWIKRVVLALLGIIAAALILLVVVLRFNYAPAILMYHSVASGAGASNRLAVSPETFDKQMRFLKTRGFNVIPAEDFARNIKENRKMPPHTVAITFDDGYKDNYTEAFPVLERYGLPATIFIIIGEVGRNDRLSWDEIKSMQSSGLISFGSHTLRHCILPEVASAEDLSGELAGSRRILEEKLGKPVKMFAYPCGFFDKRSQDAVMKAGYEFAFATHPRQKTGNKDLMALKRIRISEYSGSSFVFWFQVSGYYDFIREHRHR
ncbi:MAG: polysaccharide deacetylase family protein [Candidatus Omnitrophota bacterium]|jgi:peptidoglycan/xylan/chitin deacetylase (PgdA/CDA1 family)